MIVADPAPSEIARETLLKLAQRRIPPTPSNYLAVYQEISGNAGEDLGQEQALKSAVAALPRATAEQARLVKQLEEAVAARNWAAFGNTLKDTITKGATAPAPWPGLLRSVLVQLDTHTSGVTPAKKREAIERVLSGSQNLELVFERLQALMKSWSQTAAGENIALVDNTNVAESVPAAVAPGADACRDICLLLLENTIPSLLAETPALADEARLLANELRASYDAAPLAARIRKFSYRTNFVAEDQTEIRAALLKLLRLVIDTIGELVIEDKWLHGQIDVVTKIIDEQPLNLRQLDNVESRLRDLIIKQSALKQHLTEAQERLKAMLATFVDRLADFSESTSDYQVKIEKCAERITQTESIVELSEVLDDVMRETREMQINALRSHSDIVLMRQRVAEAEREIVRLQGELAHASELMRHDPLTGVLNRKGMDEAVDREIARAKRTGGPLSIAMLDIDNFKLLNDRLGHDAGDSALIHLANVVREAIRPQDILARYGGEEFVVLLPNTSLDDASTAMTRVQRELTRRFFLHNQEKILITFSCGVAELEAEEPPEEGKKRADDAMYLAKRMGKNRVVAA